MTAGPRVAVEDDAPGLPAHDCRCDWERCPRAHPHRRAGGFGIGSTPSPDRAPCSSNQSIRAADICSIHADPKLAQVPALKGLALTKAKRKLRAAGLEVGHIDRRPSSKKKDTVLKQGVADGTELEPRSSVPLVVAAPLPRVPSLVGKPKASAIRMLRSAGFKVKKTTQTRTTGKDGVVVSQSPRGAARVRPDSVVRIVISNVQAPSPTKRSAPRTVHPGAFCSPKGAIGVTTRGTTMICKTTPQDARARWRAR